MKELLPERTPKRQVPNRQNKWVFKGQSRKLHTKNKSRTRAEKGGRMTGSSEWEVHKEEFHSGRRERAEDHTKKQSVWLWIIRKPLSRGDLQSGKLHTRECKVGLDLEMKVKNLLPIFGTKNIVRSRVLSLGKTLKVSYLPDTFSRKTQVLRD